MREQVVVIERILSEHHGAPTQYQLRVLLWSGRCLWIARPAGPLQRMRAIAEIERAYCVTEWRLVRTSLPLQSVGPGFVALLSRARAQGLLPTPVITPKARKKKQKKRTYVPVKAE